MPETQLKFWGAWQEILGIPFAAGRAGKIAAEDYIFRLSATRARTVI